MGRYVIGETARISAPFTVDGVPTDPTAVTVRVYKFGIPAPVVLNAASSPPVVHDGVGLFHVDVLTDVLGPWHYRIEGTGPAAGVYEGMLTVLQTPFDDLLTLPQMRAMKPGWAQVPDEALQMWLDAGTVAILGRLGPIAPTTVRLRGNSLHVWLPRQASSVQTVVESWGDPIGLGNTTLASDDWALLPDGLTLRREWGGTNRSDVFGDIVTVTFTPVDDTAERQRVLLALVDLDQSHAPGLSQETMGSYSVAYVNNSVMNYSRERSGILDSLAVNVAPFA
jgi:hypothetical protein